MITVGSFQKGQKVDVSGDSMGRGFAGYQKRHGFSRGPMMLERAGKYGYDKAQLPPPDMTTEWACSTK